MSEETRYEVSVETMDARKAIQSLKRAARSLDDTLGGMGQGMSLGSLSAGARRLGDALSSVASQALEAAEAFIDMARAGQELQRTASAFEQLGGSNDKLGELRDLTRGLVDDATLQKMFNMAQLFGLSGDKVAQFAEIAVGASVATGESVDKMFSDIMTAASRSSRLIADNLGILVNVGKANEDYARRLGKSVRDLTDDEKSLAFQEALVAGGTRQRALAQNLANNEIAAGDAAITNLINEMKVFAAQIFTSMGATEAFQQGMVGVRELFEANKDQISQLVSTGFSVLTTAIGRAVVVAESLLPIFNALLALAEALSPVFDLMAVTLAAVLNVGMSLLNAVLLPLFFVLEHLLGTISLAAEAVGMDGMAGSLDRAREGMERYRQSVHDAANADLFASKAAEEHATATEGITRQKAARAAAQVKELADTDALVKAYERLTGETVETAEQLDQLTQEAAAARAAQAGLRGTTEALASAYQRLSGDSLPSFTRAAREAAIAQREFANATKAAQEGAQASANFIDGLAESMIQAEQTGADRARLLINNAEEAAQRLASVESVLRSRDGFSRLAAEDIISTQGQAGLRRFLVEAEATIERAGELGVEAASFTTGKLEAMWDVYLDAEAEAQRDITSSARQTTGDVNKELAGLPRQVSRAVAEAQFQLRFLLLQSSLAQRDLLVQAEEAALGYFGSAARAIGGLVDDVAAEGERMGQILEAQQEAAQRLGIDTMNALGGAFQSTLVGVITGSQSMREQAFAILGDLFGQLSTAFTAWATAEGNLLLGNPWGAAAAALALGTVAKVIGAIGQRKPSGGGGSSTPARRNQERDRRDERGQTTIIYNYGLAMTDAQNKAISESVDRGDKLRNRRRRAA